jgi:polyhydroxyalkanoate synthesis regulator phasin
MDNREKRDFILKLIIAVSSALTFLVIMVVAIVVVPKAVNLMNTAQRTLDNLETVSEDLKALELAEAIKNIEDDTARAMSDVSDAMDQVEKLDVETLNRSIQELKQSTEELSNLFSR